jgi:spermidine synthase
MVPRILIDTAQVPGGGELRLFRRGDDFSIMLGANELMNSRLSGSEEALASLVCDRLGAAPTPRLLIGGLGMGFTLRAALGRVGPDAAVTVAELVPAVVAWARGPMAAIFARSLEDRRVTVAEEDVVALIAGTEAGARGAWDAILLDVDNGPDGLTRRGNNRLYSATGLDAARSALRPGGMLAVWSAAPDAKFVRRLETAGFAVEEVVVKARGGRGARHVIWLAKRL